jgi:hypothetical protein
LAGAEPLSGEGENLTIDDSGERLLLLDAHRRAFSLGLNTELYSSALGDEPRLNTHCSKPLWPAAEVVFVGAELVSALRPYGRDLAQELAPPGSDDQTLEAAAEVLAGESNSLAEERLRQEVKCGFDWDFENCVHIEGARLPREGLARSLRPHWVSRRTPKHLLGIADLETALRGDIQEPCRWLLIHDDSAPNRHPEALVCPLTKQRLTLAGQAAPRLIDRSKLQAYTLWAWLERTAFVGTKILIHSDRDELLSRWAKAWFSAP